MIEKLQRQKKRKQNEASVAQTNVQATTQTTAEMQSCEPGVQLPCNAELNTNASADTEAISAPISPVAEPVNPKKPVPFVRVYKDYDHLRRETNQS